MDFSSWSPSHTILVVVVVIGFIGQVSVLFFRTKSLEERMDKFDEDLPKQSKALSEHIDRQNEMLVHALERLENRIDKRFEEVNKKLASMDASIRKLNQNHIDHLTHHQEKP